MNSWEEVEQQPEFGLLTPEDKAAVHNDWHKSVLENLTNEDPDKIDSAGVHRFMATEAARNEALKSGGAFDEAEAHKSYASGLKARSVAQNQALADYDNIERARFGLKDAEDARSAAIASDTYLGEGAKVLDQNIQKQKQNVALAESRLTPEQVQQAKEVKETMAGARPTAMFGSDLYTDPALLLDKNKYREAVQQSGADINARARALADFDSKRKQYAANAVRSFQVAGESPIPGVTSFVTWEASQPENVRKMTPEDKALQYMRDMEKRGSLRKITSALGTGLLQGGVDVASQSLGAAAMLGNSGALASKAAEVNKGAEALEEQAKLEGERRATGATTVAGAARLLPPMAGQVVPAVLTGGASLPVSAGLAGLQTAGAQFPETYEALRKQGVSEEEALKASRGAAITSGLITAGITAAFGKTGVEGALRNGAGGKELVKSRLIEALKAIPKGAGAEIPEELLDEAATQVVEQRTIDPNKPVSQIVDEFQKTAPDLAAQIALLGGAGGAIGRFRETTTQPGAAPDTDFAKRAAMEGATEYRAPTQQGETPVQVNGNTIATIPAGSDLTPDQVAEFADDPDTLKALARNGRIRLPEVLPPVPGVDTSEMDENIAAGAGLAPGTVDALKNLPPVTTGTETPVNAANVDGGSQSVQTEPAEGSIPAVTANKVPEATAESSLENQPAPEEGAARNRALIEQAAAINAGETAAGAPPKAFQNLFPQQTQPTAPNAPNRIEQQEGVRTEPAQGTPSEQTEETGAGDSLRRAEEEQEVSVPGTGKYSVYQLGDRWLIQQSDKRGFGDQIVYSQEEAVRESLRQQDMDRRNKEFWEKQKSKDEAAKAEQEAKDKPLNDYLDDTGLTAMQRGKLKKSLQEDTLRKSEEKNKVYSGPRESVVREMVADGYFPKTEEVPAIKEPTRAQWNRMDNRQQAELEKKRKAAGNKTEYRLETENGGIFVITKAEHGYAKWLVEKAELGKRPESKKPTLSERAVKARIEDLDPVPADAVDAYDLELPEGYVRQGDLYVYSPQQQAAPQQTAEWSPQTGQEASFVLNGQPIIGTVQGVRPDGQAVVRYSWNGKADKTAVVPVAQLKRPVAALATAPWYEYNQEQNSRKAMKHGVPVKPGIYSDFNMRGVFDSMSKDKSLSHIYRMVAKVLAAKADLEKIKLAIWADARRGFAGLYSNYKGTDPRIDLNLRNVGRGQVDALGVLLHEAIHHETMEKLARPEGEIETEAVEAIGKLRQRIRSYAASQVKLKRYDYELGTDHEFVSALFTRPDFQDFLASIPADFAPRTGAGKFRSVLSEIFRLISELVTGQRVPKGSPMEQAMTATLALFETPSRPSTTEPVDVAAALPENRKSLRVKVTREALTNDALSQASWKDWYQEHQDTLQRFFQEDAELFQKILAITSQAASVKANVGLALKAFAQMKEGKPFEGFLPVVAGNLNKLVSETAIGGQKIGAYLSANEGDTESVVVDRHIARMLFGVDTPSKAQFAKASKVLTEIANEIGWTPRQVQAALWAASIVKSGKTPQSYGSYIQQLHAKGTLRERIGRVVSERSEIHGPGETRGADFGRSEGSPERLTPSKVAYSPAERGYRTPFNELADTAAKLRGEQPGPTPTGLQKMFNPQPGRPATGERKLFEMPKEQPRQIDLNTAYQRAQSGSSTGWVPIKDVYAQAKEADPDLTPEEFMAHVNEQNDTGHIYVSPVENLSTVEAARPFVVGNANVEMMVPGEGVMAPAESPVEVLKQQVQDALEAEDEQTLKKLVPKEITVVNLVDHSDLDENGLPSEYHILANGSPSELKPLMRDDVPRSQWALDESSEKYSDRDARGWLQEVLFDSFLPKSNFSDTKVGRMSVPTYGGSFSQQAEPPRNAVMSPAEKPAESMFRETRSRFAPPKYEDRLYEVHTDREAVKKAFDWINAVTPERAADLLMSGRAPGWMDQNVQTIAVAGLLNGFADISSDTNATEDERTVARATNQRLGKYWVAMGQDAARSMRQRAIQNGRVLHPIAAILAAEQVLADRGEKILEKQIDGGAEGAAPRVEQAAERATEEADERVENIIARLMGSLAPKKTAREAIASMFRGKGQRDQIIDEVAKALMLKARGNTVAPERRTALANLVNSLKGTLGKNVKGEKIPAPQQTMQDLLTSAFVNQVSEGPLFKEAWQEGRQKVLDMLTDMELDKAYHPAEKRLADARAKLQHLEAGSEAQQEASAAEMEQLRQQIDAEKGAMKTAMEEVRAKTPQLEAQRDNLMPETAAMAFNPTASKEAVGRAFEQAGYNADVTTGMDKSGKRSLSIKDALLNRTRAVDAVMKVFDEAMKNSDAATQNDWPQARATALKAVNETLDSWQKQMDKEKAAKLEATKDKLLSEDSKALQKLVNSIRAKIAPDESWSDILHDLPKKQEERLAAIKDRVAKHEALKNLTDDEKDQLAKNVDKLWQRERLKAFQDELLKAGVLKAKTTKAEANVVSVAPELLRLMNLGVFNSSTFREAVSKRFGLKTISPAQADYLRKLATQAWEMPQGVLRNEKLKELVEGLQHVTGASWSETMNSYWTASVLSGLRTHFDTWMATINGLGTNLMQSGALLARGKGSEAAAAHAQWWKGLFMGLNESLHILRTGDPSFTKRFEADLIRALDGEKGAHPIAVGERLWKNGNALQKIPGALMIAVGRSMMAADHVNNTATTYGAMAVARALNPDIYGGKSAFSRKEFEDARKQALAEVTGGVEPLTRFDRGRVDVRTREILNAGLQPDHQMQASEVGDIAAFQNDPTGIFGDFYHAIKSGLGSIQRKWDEKAQDEESAKLARALFAVGAASIHFATGTRFMRFGFNLGNEFIRYMPGSWLLNKGTNILGKEMSPMQRDLLLGKNFVGAMAMLTLSSLFGDDDDDKENVWHMEGDWGSLSDEEKASRMSSGKQPRTFWKIEDGQIRRVAYSQWPLAGLIAAVGDSHDQRRYNNEEWKKRGIAGHVLRAAGTGLLQVQNSAALQQLAELFSKGSSAHGGDAQQGMQDRLVKIGVSLGAGAVPTFIKDLDRWDDPRNYQADGVWEKLAREMPLARRFVNDGRPQFNRLGEDVKVHREPYSRLTTSDKLSDAARVYGGMLARGVDFANPSTDRKVIKDGKKVPMESLGKQVVYDFEKAVATARREFLEKRAEQIPNMSTQALSKLVRDWSRAVIDREAAKVQASVNKK